MNHYLVTDLIVFGVACSAYLQYKSVKTISQLPARSQRRGQGLNRVEILKTVEGLAYAGLGVLFETVSLSKAFFG